MKINNLLVFLLNFVKCRTFKSVFINNLTYEIVFLKSLNSTEIQSPEKLEFVVLDHILNSTKAFNTENNVSNFEADPKGEILYMMTIFSIFAMIVFLIIAAKVKPRKMDFNEIADREKARYLLRNMEEHVITENILEQLRNKEYRTKAWDIYRSSSKGRRNSRLDRALETKEPDTIKQIDLKLENIQKSKKAIDERTFDESNSTFRFSLYLKEKNDKLKLDKNKVGLHKTKAKQFRTENNSEMKHTSIGIANDDKTNDKLLSNDECYYTFSGSSMEKAPVSSIKSLFEKEIKSQFPKTHKLQTQHEKLNFYAKDHFSKERFSILPNNSELIPKQDNKSVKFNCRNNIVIKNDEPRF